MFEKVLIVCVGNVCRSPMAEGLWKARMAPRGTVVESAGIGALVGRPADPTAQALMAARGIDISGHRARQLTPDLIRAADLIIVMEDGHRKAVEQIDVVARGRVHRVGRWGKFDVPDPYRRPRAEFEHALELISTGLADFERNLFA